MARDGTGFGATPSCTSASLTMAAMPSAPAGVRWIPSGWSQSGLCFASAFQSSTVISGYLRAAARIMSFMLAQL